MADTPHQTKKDVGACAGCARMRHMVSTNEFCRRTLERGDRKGGRNHPASWPIAAQVNVAVHDWSKKWALSEELASSLPLARLVTAPSGAEARDHAEKLLPIFPMSRPLATL